MRTRRRVLLLAASCLLPRATHAQEEEALRRTMAALAATPQRQASFTEQKAIPELDLPLPSEGTLRWQAPDRLEKVTIFPITERIAVAGGRLTYERPDRGIQRNFALQEEPEMQALVEAIRGTLAGDLAALRRHYDVAYATQRDGSWRMVLTPLSLRVRGAVQRIVLTGLGAEVRGVDTEGNGGVTRMRITSAP